VQQHPPGRTYLLVKNCDYVWLSSEQNRKIEVLGGERISRICLAVLTKHQSVINMQIADTIP